MGWQPAVKCQLSFYHIYPNNCVERNQTTGKRLKFTNPLTDLDQSKWTITMKMLLTSRVTLFKTTECTNWGFAATWPLTNLSVIFNVWQSWWVKWIMPQSHWVRAQLVASPTLPSNPPVARENVYYPVLLWLLQDDILLYKQCKAVVKSTNGKEPLPTSRGRYIFLYQLMVISPSVWSMIRSACYAPPCASRCELQPLVVSLFVLSEWFWLRFFTSQLEAGIWLQGSLW